MHVVVERLEVGEVLQRRERVVRHADLLALVDVRRPAVQVQQGRQAGRRVAAEAGRVVPEAGDGARLVVVVPVEGVPADVGQAGLPPPEGGLEVAHPQRPEVPLPGAVVEAHVLELEHHVHLGAGRVGEQDGVLDRDAGHLADGEERSVTRGEHLAVHLRQELVDPRAAQIGRRAVAQGGAGQRGAVVQVPVGSDVLGDHVDDVHPEAVDPAVEPPPHHRVHRLPDLGVLPVEVGLLAVEQVQVVLAAGLVERPCRAGEERLPVGRLRARVAGGHPAARWPPPVPVALRGRARRPALVEPRVLVAGVVDHQVHEQLHPARVQLGDQLVELRQRPEQRVDVLVVADVVAVVGLR